MHRLRPVALAITLVTATASMAAGCSSGTAHGSTRSAAASTSISAAPVTPSPTPTPEVSKVKSVLDVYVYREPCKSLARSKAYIKNQSDWKSRFDVAKAGTSKWHQQMKDFSWLSEIASPAVSATYCWIISQKAGGPTIIVNVLEFPDIATADAAMTGTTLYPLGDEASVNSYDGYAEGTLRVDRVLVLLRLWDKNLGSVDIRTTVAAMLKDLVPLASPN